MLLALVKITPMVVLYVSIMYLYIILLYKQWCLNMGVPFWDISKKPIGQRYNTYDWLNICNGFTYIYAEIDVHAYRCMAY